MSQKGFLHIGFQISSVILEKLADFKTYFLWHLKLCGLIHFLAKQSAVQGLVSHNILTFTFKMLVFSKTLYYVIFKLFHLSLSSKAVTYTMMRELKYPWLSAPAMEWAKTFSKGLSMTLHPAAGKRNKAFAVWDLILRKWLRIWSWKAIWMKAAPTQLLVIVNEEKFPSWNFQKTQENGESS